MSDPDNHVSYRLSEAMAAFDRGWLLTPTQGKKPFLRGWQEAPAPTREQVSGWAANYNIGVRTGSASNLIIIDIDSKKLSSKAPEQRTAHARFLAFLSRIVTPVVVTGGGQHWYFKYASGVKNTTERLAPCVDTKSDGGQCVFPGSVHPETGAIYRWLDGRSPTDVQLADFPPAAVAKLKRRLPVPSTSASSGNTAFGRAALASESTTVALTDEGSRNAVLNTAAFNLGQLVAGNQLDEGTVIACLLNAAIQAGLSERESATTIKSGIRAGLQHPRTPPITGSPSPVATVILHPSSAEAMLRDPPNPLPANIKPRLLTPGAHTPSDGEYTEISNDEFCTSVLSHLPGGLLYRRAEQIGLLNRIEGHLAFRRMSSSRCRNIVDEHISLVRWSKPSNGIPEAFFTNTIDDHAAIITAAAETSSVVRDLLSLTPYPVCLGPSFDFCELGWNPRHGAYYDAEHAISAIVDIPTIQATLRDLVVDFPFASDADRVNFFGLLLTPILRPSIDGNVPIHMAHSPLERTGKTKLLEEVFGGILLGRPTPAMQFTGSEEERDKRILALLTRADTIIHLDNLRQYLDSGALASLTTGTTYMGRVLSKSEMVTANNNLTIVGSGNNIRMSGELSKRCVSIQLVPISDHPEDRSDFAHPNLREYVREFRSNILGCLLGAIANWKAEGRPSYPYSMGGFESWSQTVGGILAANGFANHRGNQEAWIRRVNSEGEDLKAFVTAWAASFGQHTKKTPRELFALAVDHDLFGHFLTGKSEKSQLTAFSMKVLARYEDTPVGDYRIRRSSSGSSNFWFIE